MISYIRKQIECRPEGVRIGVMTFTEDTAQFSGADLVADMGDPENEGRAASLLYDTLRRCDDEEMDLIFSEEFDNGQLGPAIMNRLIRAAGHNIIKV